MLERKTKVGGRKSSEKGGIGGAKEKVGGKKPTRRVRRWKKESSR